MLAVFDSDDDMGLSSTSSDVFFIIVVHNVVIVATYISIHCEDTEGVVQSKCKINPNNES